MWVFKKIKTGFALFKSGFDLNKALNKAIDKEDQTLAVSIINKMHENDLDILKNLNFIHIAAYKKQSDVVKAMLKNGVDVNKMDKNKSIPLEFAILGEAYECAKYLLENGAALDHTNDTGHTPMMCCNSLQMAELLLQYGANPLGKNLCHNTGLLVACNKGNTEMVEFFMQKGAIAHLYERGPDSENGPGRPPIMCAATPEILEILIKHGADLQRKDQHMGKTAYEFYAEKESYQEVLAGYSSSDYYDVEATGE